MESPRTVVVAYANAFALVGASCCLGWLAGSLVTWRWGPAPTWVRSAVQIVSSAMIIAATLGFLVDVETWDQESPAERLNKGLLRAFYGLGALLFVLSIVW